jgi:hypothetical protein
MRTYEFEATIEAVPDIDGAFVEVPLDLPRTFGAGRLKVHATFDGVPYDGSVVAEKPAGDGPDGATTGAAGAAMPRRRYVIGIRRDIRARIGKQPGERVAVTLSCAQLDAPALTFFQAYRAKVERKGRTREELDQVVTWLLGYEAPDLTDERLGATSLADWLDRAPAYNLRADAITGKVCGYDVADISDPTMRRVRQLDKLVDELAKGRPLERVLRP